MSKYADQLAASGPRKPAARISEATVDKAMAVQVGWCPAVTGPDDELDRQLICDKQLGEDNRHAGNHHAEVPGGGEVAWGDKDDPWIRKGTRWPSDAGAAAPFADDPEVARIQRNMDLLAGSEEGPLMGIEIHLDGKPVSKLQAARAVAEVGGRSVVVGEPREDGWIKDYVSVYARHKAFGEIQRPALNCASFQADTLSEMRQQAQMIMLAAEIAELAEMLAAEQVTEFRTSSTGVMARCHRPGNHGPALEGATLDCDVAEHHEPAPRCTWCHEPATDGEFCTPCAEAKAKIGAEQGAA